MTQTHASSFSDPVRTVEGITEYKLDNGLTVLLFPDTSAQNVTVNITYLVGSRHEGRGEAGMAHLLEHMLFKGTPNFPNVKAVLQDHGAFYNASTWFDRTNYYETLSATDENLEFAIKLEADRMVNSWIRQADLDAEMTVVRNEFEMGENDPGQVLHDQMLAAAYQWHNYGKTTIGNRSDIERVPVKNLKAFYEYYYQPDNAVLIVAGNFNSLKTQEWILQYFGTLPKPTRLLDNTYTEEPTQDGTRDVKLLRVGDVAQTAVAYHIPAASHPDYAALLVLSIVLSREPSGLLYQSLVQSGVASELFVMVYALKEPGLFMAFARPAHNDHASDVLNKMIKQLESFSESDITPENVERAKTRILKNTKLALKSSKDIALKLSESIAQGDYRLFFYIRDQVKTITADDVLRVATTYFVESNRTTGLFIPVSEPTRALIPPTPDVGLMLEGYCGSEEIHAGEAFEATTENIDAHTTRNVLAGTIKTALLSKSTRGHAAQARLIFRFGSEESLLGLRSTLQLIPSLLRRGTKNMTFQQLQDTLDKLQSSVSMHSAQPGVAVVSISSDRDHMQDVISIVSDMMQSPRFSREEFDIVHKREIADLINIRTDPMEIGINKLDRLKNPFPENNIHYVPTIDEDIAELTAVTFEKSQRVYADLYGANHLEVAMVGDFDPSVVSVIENCFGNWSSPVAYSRVKNIYVPALGELHTLHTPDKQMAIVAMGANFAMRDDDMHYPAMRMANYIFGESMKSRLAQRLREQEGFSYGSGSSIDISRHDCSAEITLYAMCATEKADLALQAMEEEYHRWIEKGVTEQELIEGKQSFQLHFNNLLANDGYVLQTLGAMIDVNRTFGFYAQMLSQVWELKTEDIHRVLEIFLRDAPVAKVKAGDL
ncbi:MAG: insulinase family protein [Gammaproteobacteria bacterium]|nr:insulinase family protein [Gammaproteobacteria bacterium]